MIQDDTLKCHLMELMQLVLFCDTCIKISSMPFYHVITFGEKTLILLEESNMNCQAKHIWTVFNA